MKKFYCPFFDDLYTAKHWEVNDENTHFYDDCVLFTKGGWGAFRLEAIRAGILPSLEQNLTLEQKQDKLIKALEEELKLHKDSDSHAFFDEKLKSFVEKFKGIDNAFVEGEYSLTLPEELRQPVKWTPLSRQFYHRV